MFLLHPLLHGKSGRFFRYHIYAVVVFAVMYKLFDEIICRFPSASKEFGLGRKTGQDATKPADTPLEPDSLLYWMWFSLVTQTTVGYDAGMSVPTSKITNQAYKVVNFVQLISIFGITAYLMSESE